MNVEHWPQIKALFAQALEIPASQRAAFLDNACAGDAALRHEVEALLAADAAVSGFLDAPALVETRPALPDEAPQKLLEEHIGAYRLVRLLGRGGMGDVYLAQRDDGAFEQTVALKLVRRGLDTDELLSRFTYERQILAALDHPNIARLFDGGTTDDGRPYFVMEYAPGRPITDYCDDKRLTTKQRLALFRTVCRAVQYAHANLIIHRDLKPSNILVTDDGVVKLLDFGIAKLIDEETLDQTAPHTRTGLRLMTPEYASPEQIKGEAITTATDVYQLGVLLYELLTGRRPYRTTERMQYEIARVILEEEPTRPSTVIRQAEAIKQGERITQVTPETVSHARSTNIQTLHRRLAGDLDTIVLKALKKDPARRYASVDQLSADLRRHLKGLPVLARPDTIGYRLRKFILRHRVGVAATGLVVLALVGGIVTTTWQARRAQQEAARAEQINAFLQEMLSSADPRQQGREVRVADVLDAAAQRAGAELAGEPALEGAIRQTLGVTYRNLGLYQEAEAQLQAALQIRRSLYGDDHLSVSHSLYHLAWLKYQLSDYQTAEKLGREALAIRRKHLDDEDLEIAHSLNDLGSVLRSLGQYPEAERLQREALAIRRKHHGKAHAHIVMSLNNVGTGMMVKGDYDEAMRYYEEALAMGHKLFGEEHPDIALTLANMAWAHTRKGLYAEADSLYRKTLAMRHKLLGQEHPVLAWMLQSMALNKGRLARYAEAESLSHVALTLRRKRFGDEHPDVAASLNALAILKKWQGDHAEADSLYRKALAMRRKLLGNEHPDVAATLNNLVSLLRSQEQYAEAETLARETLALKRKLYGDEHPDVHKTMTTLALTLTSRGNYEEAEQWHRQALALRRKLLGEVHLSVGYSLYYLGLVLRHQGNYDEAEHFARASLDMSHKVLGKDHPDVAYDYYSLAAIKQAQGDFEEAETFLLTGFTMLEKTRGRQDSRTQEAIENLIDLYDAWAKPDEAATYRALVPEDDA